jgi:hypothetical protein
MMAAHSFRTYMSENRFASAIRVQFFGVLHFLDVLGISVDLIPAKFATQLPGCT